jgi:hypothetical protein
MDEEKLAAFRSAFAPPFPRAICERHWLNTRIGFLESNSQPSSGREHAWQLHCETERLIF